MDLWTVKHYKEELEIREEALGGKVLVGAVTTLCTMGWVCKGSDLSDRTSLLNERIQISLPSPLFK